METALPNEGYFALNKNIRTQHKTLLMYIYDWVLSDNPPISRFMNGKEYYLINYSHLSKVLQTGYMNIRNRMKRLLGDDKNKVKYLYRKLLRGRNGLTYSWVAINKDVALEAIDTKYWRYSKIKGKAKKMNDALFEIENDKICFPDEAVAIANYSIEKYSCYFNTKIPSMNSTPSKTYVDSLRKITDLYNGSFANPRVYSLSETFNNNKQFNVKGWRDEVKKVKGDWSKVRSLILKSLKNFNLMHLNDTMPFTKDHLQTNFSLWLFDEWNGQSQFIQGFKEPWKIMTFLSEGKADRIFDELPENARKAGNKFYDMNPEMGAVGLWEGVQRMTEWARCVARHDRAFTYWGSNGGDIPLKFANWCEAHKIRVNTTTLNMEVAVKSNGPWCWFVDESIKKHGLNKDISSCWNEEQLEEVYDGYSYSSIPF